MGRRRKYQPEQVVNLLRPIEVAVTNGKSTAPSCPRRGSWNRPPIVGGRNTAGCHAKSNPTRLIRPVVQGTLTMATKNWPCMPSPQS